MKRDYTYISLTDFESFLLKIKGKPYGCIWDTYRVPASAQMCDRLVRTGCRVIISIGPQADLIHDTCDEIAVEIVVIEGSKCELDTRGSSDRLSSTSCAIEEMERCLFPEDDLIIQYVAIIDSVHP